MIDSSMAIASTLMSCVLYCCSHYNSRPEIVVDSVVVVAASAAVVAAVEQRPTFAVVVFVADYAHDS